MEVLRYALVFLIVGWGGALIAGALSLVLLPALRAYRGTDLLRFVGAGLNGAGTLLAIVLAFLLCGWTGGEAKYAMFLAPLLGLVANDLWRIRRAASSERFGGESLSDDPKLRAGVLRSERLNLVADLLGFTAGILVIPVSQFM